MRQVLTIHNSHGSWIHIRSRLKVVGTCILGMNQPLTLILSAVYPSGAYGVIGQGAKFRLVHYKAQLACSRPSKHGMSNINQHNVFVKQNLTYL